LSGQTNQNKRRQRRWSRLALALLVLATAVWPGSSRQLPAQTVRNELKLKTAFVYNFTRYVRWPQSALKSRKAFVISVYGKGQLGDYLSLLVRKKLKAQGLPIVVHRFSRWSDYKPSHIVVVPKPNSRAMHAQAIAKLKGKSVLLVCDGSGLAKQGATINFFFDTNNATVGFELNIDAIKRARLSVRATLLKVADVVREPTN